MNPFTKGHKHVVDMSLIIFDSVIVGIGHNPTKSTKGQMFTMDQRLRMAAGSLAEHGDRVQVREFQGTAIDFAASVEATAIVRGIRNGMDMVDESSMAHANSLLAEIEIGRTIPTLYVPCPPSLTEISSTRVRELIQLRRSIDVLRHYVLPSVADVVEEEIYNR